MPIVLTVASHDWVIVNDTEEMTTTTFRASDIRCLQKIRTKETGLWTLIVHIHPAKVRLEYMDATEETVEKIYRQLLGLAHKADRGMPCSDCASSQTTKQPAD